MKLYLPLAAVLALAATACGDTNATPDPEPDPDPSPESICEELACDDGNPCTTNACDAEAAVCVHDPALAGIPCEVDGNTGACADGVCVLPTCNEADCIDRNPCTVGSCDPTGTECIFENALDETSCSQGRGFGSCLEGECAAGDVDFEITVGPFEPPRVTYFITCDESGSVAGDLELVDGVWILQPILLPPTECEAEFTVRDENLDPLCVATAGFIPTPGTPSSVLIVLGCQPPQEPPL
ncbi:MAG: hypothetical protein AAGF92_02010 [Myxococcota bacterium]